MEKFIKQGPLAIWGQIASKVKDAVLFMDGHCAECLHWSGGANTLFDAGARSIRELSSFEGGSENERKVVFIVSSPIVGKTAATVKDIIQASKFMECVIVTSLDARVHQYAAGVETFTEDGSFFQKLENDLSEWMGAGSVSAVIHLPIFITPVFDNFFLTPAFDSLFPVQRRDLSELQVEGNPSSLNDLHFYMFSPEYRILLRMLSSSFRNYFHILDCKEEIFALGATSHVLSVQLSNLSNQQKGAYVNRAGILFVDRTADLIGPVSHTGKSLVDLLLSVLPGLPGHYNNISVDMSSICGARCEEDDDLVYSGCLVPDTEETPLLSECYVMNTKDAAKHVTKKLINASVDEGICEEVNIEHDERNPAENIANLVSAFKGNPGAIIYNSSMLQLALSISQLLKDPAYKCWNTLSTVEKLVLQMMGENDATGVMEQIIDFVESKQEGILSFDDVCSLLIYSSLAFTKHVDTDKYDRLSTGISGLISQIPFDELPESFTSAFDISEVDLQNTGNLTRAVYRIMNFVSEIDVNNLHHLKTFIFSDVEPPSYDPLLKQLIERIFNPAKPELEPDIGHISTGRKDILKMGFSMFRKITPPRPNDYQTLIVYVIGGITATEVAQMNAVLKRYPPQDCNLIIGSNRLVSPTDIVDKTLFSNNIRPDISI